MRWLFLSLALLSACRCDKAPPDMTPPSDMSCVYGIGAACLSVPCCPGYQCVGGASTVGNGVTGFTYTYDYTITVPVKPKNGRQGFNMLNGIRRDYHDMTWAHWPAQAHRPSRLHSHLALRITSVASQPLRLLLASAPRPYQALPLPVPQRCVAAFTSSSRSPS